jgi:D-amino-acid dehydrogenase
MRADAVVLGAGIVGVSIAVQLRKRGRSVVLLDRRAPGEGTSFGNTGLIQREGVVPYPFPQRLGELLGYALNRSADAHYHLRALPRLAPFLARYWCHSRPERHRAIARLYRPLIERSLTEHAELAAEAGATALIRQTGWIRLFRTERVLDASLTEAEAMRRAYGVSFRPLDRKALAEAEPHLDGGLVGGVHWTDAASVSDPHALTMAYVGLFQRLGGRVAVGDAGTLAATPTGWRVVADGGSVEAEAAVVALGAVVGRSDPAARLPAPARGEARLPHALPGPGRRRAEPPVFDVERGYLSRRPRGGSGSPPGAEFAHRDAPPTPVQLERVEPDARGLFPLAERADPKPWMGRGPARPT